MDDADFKTRFRALYDTVMATPDPVAEITRLQQVAGKKDLSGQTPDTAALQQQHEALKQAYNAQNEKSAALLKGAKRSHLFNRCAGAAVLALGLVAGYQALRGPDVVVVDGPSSLDLIPPSYSDAQMLNEAYGANAKFVHPMIVASPDGAVVHPYIPNATEPFDTIQKGSCVYAFPRSIPSGDGRQYAMIVRRIDGATSAGYIDRARLQPDTAYEGTCTARLKP